MERTEMHKYFLARHVTCYNGQWYCYICKLGNLTRVERHLQKVHSNICSKTLDYPDKSILSDTKCRELLCHGIAMENLIKHNKAKYFCVPCKCSIPTLDHVNEHLKGRKHLECISSTKSKDIPIKPQNSKKNINMNISVHTKVQTQLANKSKFSTEIQSVCKNKFAQDNPTNGYEAEEEKENVNLPEFHKNDSNSNNILQVERCVNMHFCSLCDTFYHKLNMNTHMQDRKHVSARSALKIINQQAVYIINLEENRKTIKPLQLNSRKLDGTMWPECANSTSKYICDQCDITLEENDIINHEVTVHKTSLMASMKYIYDLALTINGKNIKIDISNYYPMFKCSFCNEIIHGISTLRIHYSKCCHKENIKLLFENRRQEYNRSKNMESFFELLEFLNVISFENNGNTIQIMEQPVMYIKNHYGSFHEISGDLVLNKLTYICIACKDKFYGIQDVIDHLSTRGRHLKHFQNILLTYNHVHSTQNLCTTKALDLNKTQAAESSVCIENTSINTLQKHNNTQVVRCVDKNSDSIAEANTDSKDNIFQSKESSSGFFISNDIFLEIKNAIILPPMKKNNSNTEMRKKTSLDRYNKLYYKRFLHFEEVMFTYSQNKINKIKFSLQLYAFKCGSLFCLACNVTHSDNIHALYDHICCQQHITQLTQLQKSSEQQRLELLRESIKVNDTNFECHACNLYESRSKSCNIYLTLHIQQHISHSTHQKKHKNLLRKVESLLQEFNTLWYNIQYFTCAECYTRFNRKIEFMEHLDKKHKVSTTKDSSSTAQFDFCTICATLWYYKSHDPDIIHNHHCRNRTHEYLAKTNDFAVTPLPQSVPELLKRVNKTTDHLFKLSNDAKDDEQVATLVNDLKTTFETQQFPVEVFMFGSRVTGSALPNSDVDIYLYFSDEYTDETELIKNRSRSIQNCLRCNSENWGIELILDRSRTPIIKLKHRPTGLQCDVSFTNSLSLENSKLIRSFNTAYPLCQKLILFLKKWIWLANLTGPEGITSYSLTWLIIFYLQVKYKIPSVAALIKSHNHSKIVSGWETGVGDSVPIDVPEISIHELLLGFFEYYEHFDYMHDVVCPLLGVTCPKEYFTEVSSEVLPDTMVLYVAQLQKPKPEYFRVDSSMCVQDPFDLSHNLTKAVPILLLKRFKHYCKESASILRNRCVKSPKKR